MHQQTVYPGTPQHQRLLQAVATYYADDLRVRAITVFGSLGRGTWDRYSDLDLDIIVADDVRIDVLEEVQQLCASFTTFNEHALLIVPDGSDAADVVLASLMGMSMRYHTLQTTSPNIVDSLHVLIARAGIDAATIRAAGHANQGPALLVEHYLDALVRWAVDVDNALHQNQFWQAYAALHRMRDHVLCIFAVTHGQPRSYHAFQALAAPSLQARIGATLCKFDMQELGAAFMIMLDVLEHELEHLSNGRVRLNAAQHAVIAKLRQRRR